MAAPTQQLRSTGRRAGVHPVHPVHPVHRARPCPSRPGRIARPRPAPRLFGSAPCPASPAPPIDLINRTGALLAVMVVTFAVVCGLVALGWAVAAQSEVPQEASVVRVGAGETVWDVAERVAPRSDVRAVAARIRALNDMSGSAVEPGMPLWVPDGR